VVEAGKSKTKVSTGLVFGEGVGSTFRIVLWGGMLSLNMVEREEGQESAFVILNHFYRSYGFHS
jgi:hypothetical protein